MTTPWTPDRSAANPPIDRSPGHRDATAIADTLLALLDRIDAYVAEHGDGCGASSAAARTGPASGPPSPSPNPWTDRWPS